MSGPTTAAGQALSAAALHYQSGRWLEPESIAAIEAEAAAAARTALLDELETAIGNMFGYDTIHGTGLMLKRAAVLREINRRRP